MFTVKLRPRYLPSCPLEHFALRGRRDPRISTLSVATRRFITRRASRGTDRTQQGRHVAEKPSSITGRFRAGREPVQHPSAARTPIDLTKVKLAGTSDRPIANRRWRPRREPATTGSTAEWKLASVTICGRNRRSCSQGSSTRDRRLPIASDASSTDSRLIARTPTEKRLSRQSVSPAREQAFAPTTTGPIQDALSCNLPLLESRIQRGRRVQRFEHTRISGVGASAERPAPQTAGRWTA